MNRRAFLASTAAAALVPVLPKVEVISSCTVTALSADVRLTSSLPWSCLKPEYRWQLASDCSV